MVINGTIFKVQIAQEPSQKRVPLSGAGPEYRGTAIDSSPSPAKNSKTCCHLLISLLPFYC